MYMYLSLGAVTKPRDCYMYVYLLQYIFSKPWAVYFSGFGHWVCGESGLAIKDLQPTAPVLKAGHPVSCSTLCVMCCVLYVWEECLGC